MDKKFTKVNELLAQESFLEKLETAETDEAVQKLFADNGVELTLDEIDQMCKESVAAHESGELSEESLDSVSGGVIGCFIVGSAAIAFYAGYGYRTFTAKNKKRR